MPVRRSGSMICQSLLSAGSLGAPLRMASWTRVERSARAAALRTYSWRLTRTSGVARTAWFSGGWAIGTGSHAGRLTLWLVK